MRSAMFSSLLHRFVLLTGLAAALLLAACSGKSPEASDPFFDKWRTLAETSQGYSQPQRVAAEKPTFIEGAPDYRDIPQKALPTKAVTLKLNNVDVGLALRSLAAVANVSIIINAGVSGKVSVNVDDTPWDNVFRGILASNALDYLWQGDILQVLTLDDKKLELERVVVQSQQAVQIARLRQNSALKTAVLPVRFAEAKDLKKNAEIILSKDEQNNFLGSVEVDEYTNSLIVQAIEDDQKRIVSMVQLLDKPRSQIVLKAHIVEATKDTARDLGIQWGGIYRANMGSGYNGFVTPGGQNGEIQPDGTITYNPLSGSTGIGSQGFGMNFPAPGMTGAAPLASLGFLIMGQGNTLDVQLTALQQRGKVNIVSSPSISTLDNQMAYTENGEKVPYVTTDSDGNTQVKFEDAVLRLEITPHIIDGVSMRMKVLVKKDEVDSTRAVQGNPYIIKKQTETTLIVKHGETIVISGLTKERNRFSESGLPGLMDVPGVRRMFSSEGRAQTMEEVLIFITPTIMPLRDDPVLGESATAIARKAADERRTNETRAAENLGRSSTKTIY